MIPQQDAIDYVVAIRAIQNAQHAGPNLNHTIPEWLIIIRAQLRKVEAAWYDGQEAEMFHRMGHVAACGLAAIEQNGQSV